MNEIEKRQHQLKIDLEREFILNSPLRNKMNERMKLIKDILDEVKKANLAYIAEGRIGEFSDISEVADSIELLVKEYEKQVNDKTKKLIDEMIGNIDLLDVNSVGEIDALTELKEKL